jgi:uncharacterized protein (TIGR03437 family)
LPSFGQGVIQTVAGTGTCCKGNDGLPATQAWLTGLSGITLDHAGKLYILDSAASTVRVVNSAGIIGTVAGNGTAGFSGDGGQATNAQLFATAHSGVAVDKDGNLFISDGNNHRIRRVNTAGIITTYAGNGTPGFSGDRGPAVNASLNYPAGIALDKDGNLYIADSSNSRVRKVGTDGIISTVAGNGNVVISGDGGPANLAAVDRPEGVTVDSAGNLYIAETSDSRVRVVNRAGVISTFAGLVTKTNGFFGDGGPATSATLRGPIGLAVDGSGSLFIADNGNGRIRKVDAAGVISTVAGSGGAGFSGDGGPATSAALGVPIAVAFDDSGSLYLGGSASGAKRVRKVTFAGPAISMTPGSLSFEYTNGGDVPAPQNVTVSSATSGLTFAAAASTTQGGSWLAINPANGTTPSILTVSVDPTGLAGGVYKGAITITPNLAGAGPQSFSVSLTLTGPSAPSITGIRNASGYQSTLAPGVLFQVSGLGFGTEPVSPAGVSVSFTPVGGGAAVDALIGSAASGLVTGQLPSSAAPGDYSVRLTSGGLASAPVTVTVAAASFGIDAVDGVGTGPAKASIDNVNGGNSLVRFTSGVWTQAGVEWTLTPAHAADTLVLTGTGGGADPANDSGGTSGDQSATGGFNVLVGGRTIAPSYAGTLAGFPGAWQVRFTLPDDIETGCFVGVRVSANGVAGNQTTIAIAAPGESACSDAQLSPASLAILDAGGSINLGGFGVSKGTQTTSYIASPGAPATVITGTQELIGGDIGRYTAAEYAALFDVSKFGSCTVRDQTGPSNARNPAAPDGYLDAGTTIPASGPGLATGAALTILNPGPVYGLLLANGTLAPGGAYALAGAGGADLAPFTADVTFPTAFAVTDWNSIATIDRAQPLTLNWTGEGIDRVGIILSTSRVLAKDTAGTNILRTVALNCDVPAAPGTYTIPAEALSLMLPEDITVAAMATGSGLLTLNGLVLKPFSAPLVGGGQTDYAAFSAVLWVAKNLAVK